MRRRRNSFSPLFAEPLEPRRLLAGVTILMHGYDGNITGWVDSAADAIADRADGSASIYTMKVAKNSAGRLAVTGFSLNDGPELDQNSSGEAIIKLDWTAVDSGSESTGDVAKPIADYLLTRHGSRRALAELPIHLVGHSRGASLAVAISGLLGERGVWVEHETFLDPHPVDGHNDFLGADFGDEPMRVYTNVQFADNYWRTDGNANDFDPDGEHVNGAHEGNLNDTVQEDFVVSAHMAVTAYYHGTIDTNAVFNGDHPVLSGWYGNTSAKPSRTQTGFYFSDIVGGKRPVDGLPPEFGGTAHRDDLDLKGGQYPNTTHIRVLSGNTFYSGQRLSIRFVAQDADSAATYNVFLDPDQNPYNGNNVITMRRVTLNGANDVSGVRISALSDGAPPGEYYVGVQSADGSGRLRLAYSAKVTVTAAPSGAAMVAAVPTPPRGVFSTTSIFRTTDAPERIATQILQPS